MRPWVALGLACWLVGAGGCALPSRPVDDEHLTVTTTDVAPSFLISAIPSYRLIVRPDLADAPSRLLALHTRIEAVGESAFHFDPADAQLVLPDGTTATAFDRDRARALLQRADLALADLSYLYRARHPYPRGGLDPAAKRLLKQQVMQRLLGEADFSAGQPLEGYLIIDIRVPQAALDGAVLEVQANRVTDAAPARNTYRFATTGIVVE